MAEVKTYKCDICGKVYHVDESVEHRVMELSDITNGDKSRDVKYYEHICPNCATQIRVVVKDPKVFDKMNEKVVELVNEKSKCEKLLRSVCNELPTGFYFGEFNTDFDYMEHAAKATIDDIKLRKTELQERLLEASNSRDKWKRVAAVTIGLLIGFGIGALLKLLGV